LKDLESQVGYLDAVAILTEAKLFFTTDSIHQGSSAWRFGLAMDWLWTRYKTWLLEARSSNLPASKEYTGHWMKTRPWRSFQDSAMIQE
jgi:hypothetical protein